VKKNGLKVAVITACLLVSGGLTTHAWAKQAPSTHDIRILIDVSGSMKLNDPDNLRTPALRLLANLLPTNAQAGVWTFGRQVNMLVPLGPVDMRWKKRATKAASEIHSRGLFTNIEEALGKSTWDWKNNDHNFERSIILLTDGLVDIDKQPEKNSASRGRILNDIIPRLARSGATVHTIALAGDADELLLQQLAAASNGWYEKVDDADKLERIFFRMFEKTTQPDTLPLVDSQVMVDRSIKEMTLLIFNQHEAQPPLLTTPSGSIFGRHSAPQNVNWNHGSRYDLITIENPASGMWHVDADSDPDNRVMVVTDLKVVTTTFPNNIYLEDEQPYFVSLTNDGKIITKQAFHRFVDITLQQTFNDDQATLRLYDDGRSPDGHAADGTYSLSLNELLTEGRHELITYVDGTTFKREKRHLINVYASPVITSIRPEKILDAEIETLFAIPRADMINPDSIKMYATISDSSGEIEQLEIPRSSHNEWKLPLGNFVSNRQHSVTIDIEGTRPNGRPVESRVGPIAFGSPVVDHPDEPATQSTEEPQEHNPPAKEIPADNKVSGVAVAIPVVMFNLLLSGGAYFGYRKWKSRLQSAQEKPWEMLAHE